MRRVWTLLAILAITAVVSGCSDFAGYQYQQYGQLLNLAWNPPSDKISLGQAEDVPYASIGVEVGDQEQRLLVLASSLSQQRFWMFKSHMVIVTQHGRIVSTGGLRKNLTGLAIQGTVDPKSALLDPGKVEHFLADFADLNAYSVPIACRPKPAVPVRIKILGHPIKTLRVDEDCRAPLLKWDFTDRFWLDPYSHMTWQSEQYIHPNFPAVRIQVLRPVAE